MALSLSEPLGATSDEVQWAIGDQHQSVSPRSTELHQAGYIEAVLDLLRRTRKGRLAQVYVATQLGKDTIRLGLSIYIRGGDPTRGFHRDNPISNAAFQSASRNVLRRKVLAEYVKRSP